MHTRSHTPARRRRTRGTHLPGKAQGRRTARHSCKGHRWDQAGTLHRSHMALTHTARQSGKAG